MSETPAETPAPETPVESTESTPLFDATVAADGEPTPVDEGTPVGVVKTEDTSVPVEGVPVDTPQTNHGEVPDSFTDGSTYDSSGMPLGTTYADYDNVASEVAQRMVRTKELPYIENPNNNGFVEAKLDTEPPITEKGWNGALYDNVNSRFPLDVKAVDTSGTEDRYLPEPAPVDPSFVKVLDEVAPVENTNTSEVTGGA